MEKKSTEMYVAKQIDYRLSDEKCRLVLLVLVCGFLSSGIPGFSQEGLPLHEAVQAILAENCLSCHGAAQMSGLDLRQQDTLLKGGSRGPALVPGRAEESLLYQGRGPYRGSQDAPRVGSSG